MCATTSTDFDVVFVRLHSKLVKHFYWPVKRITGNGIIFRKLHSQYQTSSSVTFCRVENLYRRRVLDPPIPVRVRLWDSLELILSLKPPLLSFASLEPLCEYHREGRSVFIILLMKSLMLLQANWSLTMTAVMFPDPKFVYSLLFVALILFPILGIRGSIYVSHSRSYLRYV